MKSSLQKANEVLRLLFYLVVLFIFLSMAYLTISKYKKSNSKKHKNKLLITKLKNKKSLVREKTSLVKPAIYKFSNFDRMTIKSKQDDIGGIGDRKLLQQFNYEDLINIVSNKDLDFYNNYLTSVRISIRDKKDIYKNKLIEVLNNINSANTNTALSAHNEALETLIHEKNEYEDILSSIKEIKANLSIDKIHENFIDLIWNKTKGTETMIGRMEVKNHLARKIFSFSKDPKNTYRSFQNGLIMGNSGMGKDKLAIVMSHTLHMSYILLRNKYIMTSKDALTSQFVGGTGNKTKNLLLGGLETILFINEVYDIIPQQSSMGSMMASYGTDAINQLIFFTDNFKGLSCIYGIGYENETMERFLNSNQGMDRRFPISNRIVLSSYSNEELTNIMIRQLEELGGFILCNEEAEYLHSLIVNTVNKKKDIFKVQAGAILEIASNIVDIINTAKDRKWKHGDVVNNKNLLKDAYNGYLYRHHNLFLSE